MCLGKYKETNESTGSLKCVIQRLVILKLKAFIQLGELRGKSLALVEEVNDSS